MSLAGSAGVEPCAVFIAADTQVPWSPRVTAAALYENVDCIWSVS